MATIVKFLIDEEFGEPFAYFPQLNWNKFFYKNSMKVSYAHVGQHSACSVDYAKACKDATRDQYLPLLNELKSIGYKDLKVINRK